MPREFLTPPTLPEGVVCRTLKIPDSKQWLGIFNSALLDTLNQYAWRQVNDTDLTIDEAMAQCEIILNEFWDTSGCDAMEMRGVADGDCTILQFRPNSAAEWETLTTVCDGAAGAAGAAGATGATGATGSAGATGATGAAGEDCECPSAPDQPDPTVTPSIEVRCGVSQYMADYADSLLQDMFDKIDAEVDLAQAISGWLSIIPFAAVVGEVIEWASEILTATTAAARAEVTTEFLEQVVCELYCLMPETGVVDQNMIDAWAEAVQPLATLAGYHMYNLIFIVPLNEWRRRALIGASTPYDHCEALCDCEAEVGQCELLTPQLVTFYEAEALTWSPGMSAPQTASGRTWLDWENSAVQRITLPETRCFVGVRLEIFSYAPAMGGWYQHRIRPVGGTWGAWSTYTTTGGNWVTPDIFFDINGTGFGYEISEFEIELETASASLYCPTNYVYLWME